MDENYLTTQNNDMDDIFSIANNDEETENRENINKLPHLEGENSLDISSEIENVSEIRNSKVDKGQKNKDYGSKFQSFTPKSRVFIDRNVRKSDEILKYIADHSGK